EFEDAKQSYSEAVAAFNSALLIAPDSITALNNKGIALRYLGDLQAGLSEFEDAKQSYSEAVAAFNSALLIAPDYITALNNKGNALIALGDLQSNLSEEQEALNNWQEALEMFNRCLAIAPNNDWVRNWRDFMQEFLDNLGEDSLSS
ncbi:tetratricopeptide repeat protein, partial [Microcoleus sp. D2_18a_B4]|uniref:tetratricopeptide repeat protein n=1 Tax=Microcoleus sp. D2_18a_B4 TaxID=3055329 RepID=UPI002FD20272